MRVISLRYRLVRPRDFDHVTTAVLTALGPTTFFKESPFFIIRELVLSGMSLEGAPGLPKLKCTT